MDGPGITTPDTDPSDLPLGLRRGPTHAVHASGPRVEGSARRTMSIDVPFPELSSGRGRVEARGRDLLTAADGTADVVDVSESTLEFDLAGGGIERIDSSEPGAAALVGTSVRKAFSRTLTEVLPTAAAGRSLGFSMLEEASGVVFVAGFALLRAGLIPEDPASGPERAAHQADVCAGWATGTPLLQILGTEGRTVVPTGPAAPRIEERDVDGWHDLAALEHGTVRRRRCLDVARGPEGGFTVGAHMRDSYADVETEMVLHEYLVELDVDGRGVVERVRVEPRVLPWDTCPSAVASAQRVVGVELAALPATVRGDLVGTSTCTHLNATIRTLADAACLIRALEGAP